MQAAAGNAADVRCKSLRHPGVLDVRGRRDFTLADLTLARGGPTLAYLVGPRSRDLFVRVYKKKKNSFRAFLPDFLV